ncbi:uncharacterized protein LOC123491668 [Coregonus clupeaformis]|uniref:uncharacterized protein LOC123491668 n=1 Tax=Coregonus clupeaformis TaxID=59861 RepID=UPI001E1C2E00|nr:uncharacterized protein LOC123491668 [Coregonus clupeaformis]
MKHSSDEETVKQKMKLTFEYRKKMTHDPSKCSTILTEFPRFLDVKGLIEQDFVLLFGEGTSAKFLGRWPTTFKQNIIMLSKTLSKATQGAELQELIQMAESAVDEGADTNADGRKRPGKMSPSQAEQHLVIFQKAGTSIQEHLDAIDQRRQTYLLAVGTRKSSIHAYFIILDKRALPCKSTSSLGAFNELFKTHFVFGTAYNTMLLNMYTFIQTTVYNIDIGKVKETPRVAELMICFVCHASHGSTNLLVRHL